MTAEAAVVLPVLLVVLAMAVWLLACLSAQLKCADAAGVAARLAARGEPGAVVEQAARQVAPPGADVRVSEQGDQVAVVVSARVAAFGGALSRLPDVPVEATAAALREEVVGQ